MKTHLVISSLGGYIVKPYITAVAFSSFSLMTMYADDFHWQNVDFNLTPGKHNQHMVCLRVTLLLNFLLTHEQVPTRLERELSLKAELLINRSIYPHVWTQTTGSD